ncbi:putative quinol monooxygenase [Microbacterium caowuchunii]|uniref:Antibiotic biosynthesis monooxygenase n=1 Tax=Microbacterium caowuchunii TaxID=2614638 RepID=A0A5N0TCZ4_9MICO|nr:antibiotic biosynthesis monooxygenase [Microbacterium caowuchunii]KAA9132875.1 antibiotic biosynthesis monooxygenase [Microbacterium caowuchunii]
MPDVHLTGRLVCRNAEEDARVREHLPRHIALTRAEPGCLAFEVQPSAIPWVWDVAERFRDEVSFRAHQDRVATSEWGMQTAGIERRYTVQGLSG